MKKTEGFARYLAEYDSEIKRVVLLASTFE